ncbi:MAG: sigma-54-dependent Fis family transcriptional regulator [Anaerolineae bacterium]|nr:sigma-54-dependent Fis family transcriptional regulator [Anaerolineae bacterium]
MTEPQILIVEDDLDWQDVYKKILRWTNYAITSARTVNTAFDLLRETRFDIIITDLKMLGSTGEFSGFGVLEQAKAISPDTEVIIVTGYSSREHALRAMYNGAYDYIAKKGELQEKLVLSVQGALEAKALKERLLHGELGDDGTFGFDHIIGNSISMQSLFKQIVTAAGSDVNVLINGEPGVGKRLVAETIHRRSRRKDGPFMVLDCGRFSDARLESELFGYEQGALYGLDEARPGKFERAKGGTVFLDSIGDLDISLQARLVGAICDRSVERVGGQELIALDVRIIASTDKDLPALLEARRFERRLFHALNEFVIDVPPLRQRKDGDDIPALAAMFVQRHAEDRPITFDSEAVELLHRYDYPGNVRELESAVKYALTLVTGIVIGPEHLRPEIRTYTPPKRGKIGKPTNGKDPDAILRICPLNLGACSKKDEILRLYAPQRVFVNVSYAAKYEDYETALRLTLEKYSLVPVLSKDYLEPGMLMCNVCKLIQTCKYGITDISAFGGNVLYELGLMHAIGVPCAILKEYRTDLAADIQGLLFLEYSNVDTLALSLSRWIARYVPEAKLSADTSPSQSGKRAASLAPDLNGRLQETLIGCGPFDSDQELRTLFVDTRIAPWREQLPQASTPIGRARAIIDFLHNQFNSRQENALVLLLRVLCDQTKAENACHRQLAQLAEELAAAKRRNDG